MVPGGLGFTVYDGLGGSCDEKEYENEEFQIMNIKLSFT